MKSTTVAAMFCLIGLGGFLAPPPVKADTWNQLTKVTFSGPVEIPGQVLGAGTYWFKLLDLPATRNIVQIYNQDQSKQVAMVMAIPDYRLKPTGKTVITFEERAANNPPAIKAWFYPGDNFGQEFVYPKARAQELAKAENQPVPSFPQNLESNTKVSVKSANEPAAVALKNAPVKAEQPSGQEVEVSQVTTTPPQLAQNTAPAQTTTPKTPAELPHTASTLPLIALAGLLLSGIGLSLNLAAGKVK